MERPKVICRDHIQHRRRTSSESRADKEIDFPRMRVHPVDVRGLLLSLSSVVRPVRTRLDWAKDSIGSAEDDE